MFCARTENRVFARTAELESVVRVWKESLCKPYAPGVSETAAGFRRIVSDATLPGIVLSAKARNADVCLSVDAKLAAEEYVLEISSEGIAIRGGSPSGVRWGLQTLSQVLIGCANEQPGNETLRLSGLRIADKPRFAYRGAMLDCCRHFFTVEEVKSFIDVMFLHKLNTFHWHLTDDQGWRIEIRKYPFLTQIGSMRKETLIGHIQKSKEYDGTPYGGYYTQDQIREVVAYAAARGITIVPEIEMPGHAQAALAAYPHLGCRGEGTKCVRPGASARRWSAWVTMPSTTSFGMSWTRWRNCFPGKLSILAATRPRRTTGSSVRNVRPAFGSWGWSLNGSCRDISWQRWKNICGRGGNGFSAGMKS